MTLKRFLFLSLITLILLACGGNRLDVDISSISLDIKYHDLNSIIMESDSTELMSNHQMMQKETEELYDYYVGYVMQTRKSPDSTFYNSIIQYRKDTMIQLVNKEISRVFPNLSSTEQNLTSGFKHLAYHLSEEEMPDQIAFINSNFVSSIFCSEKDIAIGLDRYLGYHSEIMKYLPTEFYDWVRRAMDKKYLEVDVISGWSDTHLVEESEGSLIADMIRWGKIQYLVHAAFPDKEIPEILRYSQEEYDWALENEYAFWKYLVDEKMLFDNDEQTKSNLLNPGPTTSGLPTEGSPDRMGRFTGWRMVEQYMNNNDITIKELLELNYNDILQEYEID